MVGHENEYLSSVTSSSMRAEAPGTEGSFPLRQDQRVYVVPCVAVVMRSGYGVGWSNRIERMRVVLSGTRMIPVCHRVLLDSTYTTDPDRAECRMSYLSICRPQSLHCRDCLLTSGHCGFHIAFIIPRFGGAATTTRHIGGSAPSGVTSIDQSG